MARRVTPRQAAALIVAFVLGGVAAVAAERLTRDVGTNPSSETLAFFDGTVTAPGEGPLAVQAQVVRLPDGFVQRRTPERPTLTLVQSGRVEIDVEGATTTYLAGASFFTTADEQYTIRVLETAELSVVDLGPPDG